MVVDLFLFSYSAKKRLILYNSIFFWKRKLLQIGDVEYVDGGDGFDSVDGGVIDDYVLGLILLIMVMKFLLRSF